MTNDNKAVARASFEALNRRDFDAMLACYHPEAVIHDMPDDVPATPEGLLTVLRRSFLKGFPDAEGRIDRMIAEDDHVATFWSWTAEHKGEWGGVPATGREVSHHGVTLHRYADGKIIEERIIENVYRVLQELRQP